jgi:hypothetical protein
LKSNSAIRIATKAKSSLPGGVAKATREFVKSLDRKQRFDMNKSGLEITARPADAAVDAPTKSSAEAATG